MDFFKHGNDQSSSSASAEPTTSQASPASNTGSGTSAHLESMTITEALVYLKTLDKRIQKRSNDAVFISLKGQLRKPDVRVEKAQSNYDCLNDLMSRRVRMKSAIVKSNALTRCRVAGVERTVAEHIEFKTSIKNYKNLLAQMKSQYSSAIQSMEYDNNRVRQSLENSLMKSDPDGKNQFSMDDHVTYMKMHGVELEDPLDLAKKIEELETLITTFEDSVDVELSMINAQTRIEF